MFLQIFNILLFFKEICFLSNFSRTKLINHRIFVTISSEKYRFASSSLNPKFRPKFRTKLTQKQDHYSNFEFKLIKMNYLEALVYYAFL